MNNPKNRVLLLTLLTSSVVACKKDSEKEEVCPKPTPAAVVYADYSKLKIGN